MRRAFFPVCLLILAVSIFPAQQLISEEPNAVARIPIAHFHAGFSKNTFCYGHLLVSRESVAYVVEKSEEGQDFEKEKRHGFQTRPDNIAVVAKVVTPTGPEGLKIRVAGKEMVIFEVADWTKLGAITAQNRPIIQPMNNLLMALKYPDAVLGDAKQQVASQTAPQPELKETKIVELGQTPEQVEKALGRPDKIVNLGAKKVYVYKDMKIVFTDGKVADVQ